MPKDFVRFKLTAELGTDVSDASGSGIFNVRQRVWADDVIKRLGLPRAAFPNVHASEEVVGVLSQEAATELGLPHGIPVSAGCADQPAQDIGNGLLDPPLASIDWNRRSSICAAQPAGDRPGTTSSYFLSRTSVEVVSLRCHAICGHGAEMAPHPLGKRKIKLFGAGFPGFRNSTWF